MTHWKNKELIQIGWTKTRENFWFLVALMVLSYVLSFIGQQAHIGFVADTVSSFILTYVFLQIARGHKMDFKNLFEGMSGSKILHYFLGILVSSIFFILGLILFVVPGIIVGTMLIFVTYILVDEDKKLSWKSWTFWRALKKSVQMTKGVRGKLFVFLLVLFGINILGVLAFVVGLAITIPLSGIALAALYDKLKARAAETVVVPLSNNDAPLSSETTTG